jgi:putative methionine-R-sulfoxide reductase with GAF domain
MLGVVLAAVSRILESRRRSAAEKLLANYKDRFADAVGAAIQPLAQLIARIAYAAAKHRQRLRGRLEQMVVSTLISLSPPSEGKRAVFYELENGNLLRRTAYAGRDDEPRETFEDGDGGPGTQAFGWMRRRELVSVPDIEEARRGGLVIETSSRYKSFLLIGVFVDENKYLGTLHIDSPHADAFSEADEHVLRALAALLAAGLAAGRRQPLNRQSAVIPARAEVS